MLPRGATFVYVYHHNARLDETFNLRSTLPLESHKCTQSAVLQQVRSGALLQSSDDGVRRVWKRDYHALETESPDRVWQQQCSGRV